MNIVPYALFKNDNAALDLFLKFTPTSLQGFLCYRIRLRENAYYASAKERIDGFLNQKLLIIDSHRYITFEEGYVLCIAKERQQMSDIAYMRYEMEMFRCAAP